MDERWGGGGGGESGSKGEWGTVDKIVGCWERERESSSEELFYIQSMHDCLC